MYAELSNSHVQLSQHEIERQVCPASVLRNDGAGSETKTVETQVEP